MIDQKKHRVQSEALSLLALKLMLTEAKRESPPQTRKEEQRDEELALKLIAGLKKKYRKIDVVARVPARINPHFEEEIASLPAQRFARNDMKVEP